MLLDPYAKGNTNTLWKPVDACQPGDNLESSMRAVITDGRGYDWEGDEPLRRPMSDTIVYELQRPRLHDVADRRASSTRARSPA